ncbi:MAG: hypothetical protein C4313_00230 [Thermoflexus sp.]|uniref:hypothetical protein n=1 Tax=Thermoflexus sp. TaxID=1969742 RepID=UPI0033294E62
MKSRRKRMKAFVAAAAGLLLAGLGAGYRMASGSPAGLPFCKLVQSLNLPQDKRAVVQEYCQSLEAAHPAAAPQKGVKVPPPAAGGPQGGPVYGIVGGGGLTPPPWAQSVYVFTSTWLGRDRLVYAGALARDESVGVVVVATRFSTPIPERIAEYTLKGHGALTLVGANDAMLSLVASDGTHITFDVNTGTLATH